MIRPAEQLALRLLRANRNDDGMATVVASFCAVALIATTVLILHIGAATLARQHAETAADLGALAGASVALRGRDAACAAAGRVAAVNGGTIQDCSTDGADVLVQVRVVAHLGPLAGSASGRARAGPLAARSP